MILNYHSHLRLGCPANCSEHGMCDDDGSCDCDDGWTGELCDQEVCPSNCSGNGECDLQLSECICSDFYIGEFFKLSYYHLCVCVYCVCVVCVCIVCTRVYAHVRQLGGHAYVCMCVFMDAHMCAYV